MIRLTRQQWAEIYYAIVSKRCAVQNGEYGRDGEDGNPESTEILDWAEALRDIERAIGVEGGAAAEQGVAAVGLQAGQPMWRPAGLPG